MNVLSLFDGMSCGRLALERAGVEVNKYYSSEIDEHTIRVSEENYPDTIRLGSVENWENWDIDWENIDLVIAGSPCQGFSYAGAQLAFNDERSRLYFTFEKVLEKASPKYWFLENVRMKKEHLDTISTRLGVQPVKIDSNKFSAQNRVRYYWCNWDIPEIPDGDSGESLQDVVPDAAGVWVWPRGWNKGGFKESTKCPTLTTSSWKYNFLWYDRDMVKHRFTAEQAERFQTVPVGYTNTVPDTARFKMLGNGWTVDVVAHIFKGII